MKKSLLALLLTAVPLFTTAQLTVSASQYTTEQLVKTVLLNNSCTSVSNISSNTIISGNGNSIGYFQKNSANFPFASGVVISTGNSIYAAGPLGSTSSTVGSSGDADLNAFMTQSGIPFISADASILEFDFVAFNSQVSLDYLYASNEYGAFQCGYGDAMLFLLTNTSTGAVSNMAVVPNTSIPVSAFSIRSNAVNTACASSNPQYFGSYYVTNPTSAPVNFRGITVPLTAHAAVIPGTTYHLKIVIADKTDTLFDSAIFLEAGSLNIGTLEDLTLSSSNGTVLCGDETTLLNANAGSGCTYQWQYNGTAIADAVSGTLTVTQPGDYTVNIIAQDTECGKTETITILGGTDIPSTIYIPDYGIIEGNSDGYAEFDLTAFAASVSEQLTDPAGYMITFYETQADAESGINSIQSPYTNTQNNQVIFIRIQKLSTNCFEIFSFQINVQGQTPAPTAQTEQTFTEGATLADVEIDGENILWYSNDVTVPAPPTEPGGTLPLTTILEDSKTYYASQTINWIESKERLAVTTHLILGLNDAAFGKLQYYPNPVKAILTITNSTIESISVTNIIGQQILNKSINAERADVDMGSLPAGIYIVKIETDGKTKSIKIIKK